MQLKSYSIDDPLKVHAFFRGFRSHPPGGWWFRGQADAAWKLLPKAGRQEYLLSEDGKRAFGRFYQWSREALAYHPTLPTNDWERLAIAQHFGLATCLLDWSYNPLVALYFACRELPSRDGAVFLYEPEFFVQDESDIDTTECNAAGYIPRAISPRVLNQKSIFTVHLPVTSEISIRQHWASEDHPNLAMLTIQVDHKAELLKMLDDYGINDVTLFPDLEGLSRYVNWETRGMVEETALT